MSDSNLISNLQIHTDPRGDSAKLLHFQCKSVCIGNPMINDTPGTFNRKQSASFEKNGRQILLRFWRSNDPQLFTIFLKQGCLVGQEVNSARSSLKALTHRVSVSVSQSPKLPNTNFHLPKKLKRARCIHTKSPFPNLPITLEFHVVTLHCQNRVFWQLISFKQKLFL